jgi:hypothetical protein
MKPRHNLLKLPFLCLFFLAAVSLGALDFGLAINQELKTSNESRDTALFYTPLLSPWVSGPLGEGFYLHLSGKISFEYTAAVEKDSGLQSAWREPAALPELDRSELTWLVSPALSFTAGRQRLEDPSGLVASGLFDGLSAAFSAGGSRFSAGLYYTGLLYKNAADIIMTNRDKGEYAKPFSLDETYFASRRTLASFIWESPGLSLHSSLALGLLGQFDVNEGEDRFHSQYFSARYRHRLPANISLEIAEVFGIGENGDGDAGIFFASALGGNWALPGFLDDQLSLHGLYSSPSNGERIFAFTPVNSLPQGQVFGPAIGGLALVRAAYSLRPHPLLSLGAEYTCFIRTDTVSFEDDWEPEKLKDEGYILGGELYGTVLWTPLPDLALMLGGGAFFPGLGNAFEAGAAIRWKAALGLILSL